VALGMARLAHALVCVALLGCGSGSAGSSEAESTSESTTTSSGAGTESEPDDSDTDSVKLDVEDTEWDPKPQELVIALGRGTVDGAASFAPPQRIPTSSAWGLVPLSAGKAHFLATWYDEQICLARVSRRGDLVTLVWRDECFEFVELDPQVS